MKKKNLLFMSIFLFSVSLFAQKNNEAPKVKFEKVSEEELKMQVYPNDTTAEAVILYDEGTSYINYVIGQGFMLNHERFVRIKILRQKGVDWGNFRILLYSSGKSHEAMSSVKGTTFNLENGKIVKSELKKDAVFKERENKFWEAVRLSMPLVKVGSVIDLQYKIHSDLLWNLRAWKFQYTIPVKWSQYHVVYPEYFTYNQSNIGFHPLLYNRTGTATESINIAGIEHSGGSGLAVSQANFVAGNITYTTDIFDYAAENIPAMKAEPILPRLTTTPRRLNLNWLM